MKVWGAKHTYEKAIFWTPFIMFYSNRAAVARNKYFHRCCRWTYATKSKWKPVSFRVSFIHTFGITNLILYSIIANNRLFQSVRLRSIAFVCVATALVSYLIPYLTTPVLRGTKWGIDYLVHALLFSVLPALLPIFIKYAIWRIKRKPNVKQDDIA